jgi:hypothetical protein
MPEHLSAEQITSYRERRASPEELLRVDDHISQCPECRERLLSPGELRAALQGAGSPRVASQGQHLVYEQLEAFVDRKMSRADRKSASAHLKVCEFCSEDLRDLNAFKAELAGSGNKTAETLWSSLAGWLTLRRISLVVATAGVIVLAVLVGRRHQTPPQKDPSVVVANLGAIPAEMQTAINELPLDDQSAIREAIAEQRIKSPNMLAELQGGRQTLLGETQKGPQFEVLSPLGEAVLDVRPAFRWQAVSEATSYSVAIFDAQLNQVESSGPVNVTEWTPRRPLKRGELYLWQVTARLSGGKSISEPSPPSPEAKFKVVSEEKAGEIAHFQEAHHESHVVLGILYAQAGALEKAQHELEQLPKGDPNYELAQKLLKSVMELRRPPD